MTRTRNGLHVAIAGWLLLMPAAAQEDRATPELDITALVKAGRTTLERFQKQSSSWTAEIQGPGDGRTIVEVVAAPGMRLKRSILTIEGRGRRAEVLRIVARGDAWYVTEGQRTGKYRPYEAPFNIPTAYFYLLRSEPQVIAENNPAAFRGYEGKKDGIATFRSPLPQALRTQLQRVVAEVDAVNRRNPGQSVKAEMAQTLAKTRELLDKGIASCVNLASGMIVQDGAPDRRVNVRGFRWHERLDPKTFDVEGGSWEDFTDDPTRNGTADLVMIGHCGLWQPGMRSPELDGRLLDVKTGRYRRIPFQGEISRPGCFLKDRTRVVVTGFDLANGVIGLYEIDLKSGANHRLGGERLVRGLSLFPTLSPDGKTLAVLHKGASERMLETQVSLVNLETGAVKPLGKPHDMAYPSWLPDGRGLILRTREPTGRNGQTIDTIARMDLEGRLTKLREGSSPVLLGDGKTILFQESSTLTWHTCDLDGGKAKLYVDGLKGYGFPAPAPDGKRLLLMHYKAGTAPEPVILQIGDRAERPVTTVPGLWGAPAWR